MFFFVGFSICSAVLLPLWFKSSTEWTGFQFSANVYGNATGLGSFHPLTILKWVKENDLVHSFGYAFGKSYTQNGKLCMATSNVMINEHLSSLIADHICITFQLTFMLVTCPFPAYYDAYVHRVTSFSWTLLESIVNPLKLSLSEGIIFRSTCAIPFWR